MKTTGRVPHAGAAVVVALLLGAWPVPAAAAGDHDGCTGFIDEVPVVILTPGTWCLRSDLAFAVDVAEIAIDVQADGVTIDCHDRRLVGKASARRRSATATWRLSRSRSKRTGTTASSNSTTSAARANAAS